MKHRFFVLAFLLVLTLGSAAQAQQDAAISEARTLVEALVAESGAPGVAVSVGVDGRIVWSEGFGYADVEQRVPVWPAITRFRVGSVSKPMTAVAIAQLVDEGRLDLDAPVQRYVPSFPEKEGEVTTRLLAGHLAGVRHYRGEEFLSLKPYPTVREGLEIFQDDPLEHAPGERFTYSSYGWNLISAVIEGASEEEFLSYVEERVFAPIGMRQTVADHVRPIVASRTRYYVREDGELWNAPPVDNSYKWAGGGFLSTSEDLVRFGFAHLEPGFLKPETLEVMWTSQRTTAGEETGYGIGWQVDTDPSGRRRVGHGGGSVGGSTVFSIYPGEKVVLAMISNLSRTRYGEVPRQVAELFLGNGPLLAHLRQTRQRFLDAVAGLSEAQLAYKPAEDRWSIAEVSEHITASETFLRDLVAGMLQSPPLDPPQGTVHATEAADDASHDQQVLTFLGDRSQKFQSPEPIRPTGRYGSMDETRKVFEEERAATLAFAGENADLRSVTREHPAFGQLDAYGWLLFLSGHTGRHTEQIEEVKADPGFPEE